jgi:hypothetical protein
MMSANGMQYSESLKLTVNFECTHTGGPVANSLFHLLSFHTYSNFYNHFINQHVLIEGKCDLVPFYAA